MIYQEELQALIRDRVGEAAWHTMQREVVLAAMMFHSGLMAEDKMHTKLMPKFREFISKFNDTQAVRIEQLLEMEMGANSVLLGCLRNARYGDSKAREGGTQ